MAIDKTQAVTIFNHTLKTTEDAGVEVSQLSTQYGMLKDTIEAVTIDNETDLKNANDLRLKVNKFVKTFETVRKEFVTPYNDKVKAINVIFNGSSALFEKLLGELDKKILPYMKIVADQKKAWEKAKEAEIAAAAEAEKNRLMALAAETDREEFLDLAITTEQIAAEDAARGVHAKKSVKGAESATFTLTRWYYKVTNFELVPKVFLGIDDAKIKQFIKDSPTTDEVAPPAVAGLEFYSETTLNSRGR